MNGQKRGQKLTVTNGNTGSAQYDTHGDCKHVRNNMLELKDDKSGSGMEHQAQIDR